MMLKDFANRGFIHVNPKRPNSCPVSSLGRCRFGNADSFGNVWCNLQMFIGVARRGEKLSWDRTETCLQTFTEQVPNGTMVELSEDSFIGAKS